MLVVVPVHLARQWAEQFLLWAPSLAVLTLAEKKDIHRVSVEQLMVLDALVVSVNQVRNFSDIFPSIVFSVLVMDEAMSCLSAVRPRAFPAHYGRWFLCADKSPASLWDRLIHCSNNSDALVRSLDASTHPLSPLHGALHDLVPVRHNANPHVHTQVTHRVHANPLLPEERLLMSEQAMRSVRGVAFPKAGITDENGDTNVTFLTHRELLDRIVQSHQRRIEVLKSRIEDAKKTVCVLDAIIVSEQTKALPAAQQRTFALQREQQLNAVRDNGVELQTMCSQLAFREAAIAALKGGAECPICMGSNEDEPMVMLPGCAHVFGAECLGQWSVKNQTCPQCRHRPGIWEVVSLVAEKKKGSEDDPNAARLRQLQQLHGSKVAAVLMHMLDRPSTHRFLVAAKLDSTARQLCHALENNDIHSVRVTGDAASQRRALSKFTASKSAVRVLVVSDTAAASGSNLQDCVDEIIMTHVPCVDTALSVEAPDMRFIRQTIGRAARGKREKLDVHWFLTADTVEEKMYCLRVAPEVAPK